MKEFIKETIAKLSVLTLSYIFFFAIYYISHKFNNDLLDTTYVIMSMILSNLFTCWVFKKDEGDKDNDI